MKSFLENVNGCCLTALDIHSSIVFPSPSDAMFAALILKYSDVTLEIFDDILSLLQRRDFRASDIRFRRPEEYMEHILSQRREIAKTRQSINQGMAVESSQHRNDDQFILSQIVELVADHIERERTPFQHVTKS